MKTAIISLYVFSILMIGGIWRMHEVPGGKDWGAAVSGFAQSDPGAIPMHML